jgi:hypothetical protein
MTCGEHVVKVRNISLNSAEQAVGALRGSEDSLTLVIRDDTEHVTSPLKERLVQDITSKPSRKERFNMLAASVNDTATVEQRVDNVVNNAYQTWLRNSFYALAKHLDVNKYDLDDSRRNKLFVHMYNAQDLTDAIVDHAKLMSSKSRDVPPYLISLDDMIHVPDGLGGDISFSRLFSICGRDYFDYTARPGHPAIAEQMKSVREDLKLRYQRTGEKQPIILLEDNVRHARMLNWLENQMDEAHLFDYGYLAGIATCFCSANDAELSKIKHKGKSVPVSVGVNYHGVNSDVQTPRDLLFDGFVVKIDGQKGRLPGIFMDVASRFSVKRDHADEFTQEMRDVNYAFCEDIQKNLGVNMPLSWFIGAKPVSYVTNTHTNTSMMKVMK